MRNKRALSEKKATAAKGDNILVKDSLSKRWHTGVVTDILDIQIEYARNILLPGRALVFRALQEWKPLGTKTFIKYQCLNGTCKTQFLGGPGPMTCPVCEFSYVKRTSVVVLDKNNKVLSDQTIQP